MWLLILRVVVSASSPEEDDNLGVEKTDIRFYLKKNKQGQNALRAVAKSAQSKNASIRLEDYKKNDRMGFMRDKIKVAREINQYNRSLKTAQETRQTRTLRGKRLLEGREVENNELIQDEEELVIVGSDVEALYPSLSDIEAHGKEQSLDEDWLQIHG